MHGVLLAVAFLTAFSLPLVTSRAAAFAEKSEYWLGDHGDGLGRYTFHMVDLVDRSVTVNLPAPG